MTYRHPLLAAVATLLCSAALHAQSTEYHFDVDQNAPPISWELQLNLGDVTEQPPTFNLDGLLVAELDSPTAPFTSGQMHGSLLRSVPLTITGVIDNPIPLLPPLGTFTVTKLQAEIHTAGPFAIQPNGDFVADAVMHTSAGTVTVSGIFGTGSLPLAGVFEIWPSIPIQGNITQNGSDIDLHVDLNVTLPMISPTPLITGSITLNGPFDAKASTTQADPMCVIVPYPLPAGGPVNIQVRNATPTLPVYLAASTAGLGSFTVGSLGVVLALTAPFQAAPSTTADVFGTAFFQVNVPAGASGLSVWLQALQLGDVSNVAGTWVQ